MALLTITLNTSIKLGPNESQDTSEMGAEKTISVVQGSQSVIEVQISNDSGDTWASIHRFNNNSSITLVAFAELMRVNVLTADYSKAPVVNICAEDGTDLQTGALEATQIGTSEWTSVAAFDTSKTFYCSAAPNFSALVEGTAAGEEVWTPLTVLKAGEVKQINFLGSQIRATTLSPDYRQTPIITVASQLLGSGGGGGGISFPLDQDITFNPGEDRWIEVLTPEEDADGTSLTIKAGDAHNIIAHNGGHLNLIAGNAVLGGAGGNVNIEPGDTGEGDRGVVSISGVLEMEYDSNPILSTSGTGRIRYNSDLSRFEASANGGGYQALGGGSGLTIIQSDGELDGVYEGDVLCLGNAIVVDNVDIYGNLTVNGQITNPYPHQVFVRGDFTTDSAIWGDNGGYTEGEADTVILGNFYFAAFTWYQSTPETSPTLRVGGSFVGKGEGGSVVDMGANQLGCDGCNLEVRGSISGIQSIALNGNFGGSGGDGGSLTCYGDISIRQSIEMSGGTSSEEGVDAGYSGNLTCYGNVSVGSVYASGGAAANAGNAGSAGNCVISGNAEIYEIYLVGGACQNVNPVFESGHGGAIDVGGSWSGYSIIVNGGDRTDAFGGEGAGAGCNAGEVYVGGTLCVDSISMIGGSVDTGFPCTAGIGGFLEVNGNLIIRTSLEASGGSGAADGGNANTVIIHGYAKVDTMNVSGGNGEGVRGIAGTVLFNNGATIGECSLSDGTGGGSIPDNPSGVFIGGDCSFKTLVVPDRAAACIAGTGFRMTKLHIGSLSGKETLRNQAAVESGNISSLIPDSIFIFNPTVIDGTWTYITSEAIPPDEP